jgi:methionyl aminopeptidase
MIFQAGDAIMTVRGQRDIDGLRSAGRVVAETLETMKAALKEGMTTKELDQIGAAVLKRYGAHSAPSKLYRFPGTTCISVNEEAAHGIPSDRVIRKGDLINIDVSAELGGYYADTGFSVPFGITGGVLFDLCACSQRALRKGLGVARAGEKINRVGEVVERTARDAGFSVIRNLAGHGIGFKLHEDPEILSWKDPRQRARFTKGMAVAVETFVSTGGEFAVENGDGWTLVADDGGFVAQYEHTIVITEGEPMIMTKLG